MHRARARIRLCNCCAHKQASHHAQSPRSAAQLHASTLCPTLLCYVLPCLSPLWLSVPPYLPHPELASMHLVLCGVPLLPPLLSSQRRQQRPGGSSSRAIASTTICCAAALSSGCTLDGPQATSTADDLQTYQRSPVPHHIALCALHRGQCVCRGHVWCSKQASRVPTDNAPLCNKLFKREKTTSFALATVKRFSYLVATC